MLRYIYANDLNTQFPALATSMYRDRAEQFHHRLGWDVHVDENGLEIDSYDTINPLYVIWEQPDGSHGGSMRFLPTTGTTMVNDHFLNLTDGVAIQSPFIWECTRFCLAPGAAGDVAGALMLAGGELMRAFDLTHLLGVFDHRMVRIYKMIGASPIILGQSGTGRDQIAVGLWEYDVASRSRVLRRAGLSSQLSERWFERSFGHTISTSQARKTAA